MNIIDFFSMHGYVFNELNSSDARIAAAGIGLAIIMCLLSLLYIAARVLFGLAAYNDARAKSNSDAVMWGLLIGFLGLIPGIIYLCVRNSGRNFVICQSCGCSHYFGDRNCPKCGAQNQSPQYVNPLAPQQEHRARVQLTIAIVLVGIAIIATIISIIGFAATAYYYAGDPINY